MEGPSGTYRCGQPPSGQQSSSSLSSSELGVGLRKAACLLHSPSTNAAIRALLLGGADYSSATCKSIQYASDSISTFEFFNP
jgi:hypothetical protein